MILNISDRSPNSTQNARLFFIFPQILATEQNIQCISTYVRCCADGSCELDEGADDPLELVEGLECSDDPCDIGLDCVDDSCDPCVNEGFECADDSCDEGVDCADNDPCELEEGLDCAEDPCVEDLNRSNDPCELDEASECANDACELDEALESADVSCELDEALGEVNSVEDKALEFRDESLKITIFFKCQNHYSTIVSSNNKSPYFTIF